MVVLLLKYYYYYYIIAPLTLLILRIHQYNIYIAGGKGDSIYITECDEYTWTIEDNNGIPVTTTYTSSTVDSMIYTVHHNFNPIDSFLGLINHRRLLF